MGEMLEERRSALVQYWNETLFFGVWTTDRIVAYSRRRFAPRV